MKSNTMNKITITTSFKANPKFLFASSDGKWATVVSISNIADYGYPLVPVDSEITSDIFCEDPPIFSAEGDFAEFLGLVLSDVPEGEVDLSVYNLPIFR